MASSCGRGGLDWTLGKISSWKGLSSNGTGCPGVIIPGVFKRRVGMWYLGTWFSVGLGSIRFTVELDDVEGLIQPKRPYDYDSVIL